MKNDFLGKKILILGKGISGLGACEILKRRGAYPVVCDKNDFDIALKDKYDLIVVSPSIPLNHEVFLYAKSTNTEIVGEIELGYRLTEKPIVAITGTNGKTTVTDMATHLLSAKYSACACGNIGVSFSLATDDPYEIYVVETSSFQLETVVNFAPKVAVVTNLAPDHIDRHGSYNEYIKQKSNIAKNLTNNDYLILSYDDIAVDDLRYFDHNGKTVFVSIREKVNGAYCSGNKIFWYDEFICNVDRISLRYDHNVTNALFAIAVAKIFGIENSSIKKRLGEFVLRDHRLSIIDKICGVTFYNDSKATNVSACVSAMKSMVEPYCLILGGSDKGYDFDEIFINADMKMVAIVAVGETADKISATAKKYGFLVTICASLKSAVVAAYKTGAKSVLFSPACASFDMYNSYSERGNDFISAVRELKKSEKI